MRRFEAKKRRWLLQFFRVEKTAGTFHLAGRIIEEIFLWERNRRDFTESDYAGAQNIRASQLRIHAAISRKRPALDFNAQRYFLTI
jgi:hypothetical protein